MGSYRKKIILVDDIKANLTMGKSLLKTFYEVYPATSAERLFEILEKIVPDLILLDIEMPETDGYEAIKKLKADTRFCEIPVIFLTSKNDEISEMDGFDLGAADYIAKPFSAPILLKRIAIQLLVAEQKRELLKIHAVLQDNANNLEEKVREKTAEIFNLQNTVVSTIADLVEFRDKHTGGHILRTQRYLKALIDGLKKANKYAEDLACLHPDFFLPSAPLHDVGKIAITDLILNKPGKLTPEEFEIMKTHVQFGIDAIERIMEESKEHDFLRHALLIAGTHHENWDGSGYPLGLRGLNIPIEGRLMAIADVYDALISPRPYKEAMPHEEACKIIEEDAGKKFDPTLVGVFRTVKDEFWRIAYDLNDPARQLAS